MTAALYGQSRTKNKGARNMKQYRTKLVDIPDRPDVLRIVITPTRKILINRSAAPDANVIWLLQHPDDRVPFLVNRC